MQIAIAIPSKNNSEPITIKIQPRNSGGYSSPGFGVPCRAANMKMTPTAVKERGKSEERSDASDNVMKNRQEIKLFSIAIHTL